MISDNLTTERGGEDVEIMVANPQMYDVFPSIPMRKA